MLCLPNTNNLSQTESGTLSQSLASTAAWCTMPWYIGSVAQPPSVLSSSSHGCRVWLGLVSEQLVWKEVTWSNVREGGVRAIAYLGVTVCEEVALPSLSCLTQSTMILGAQPKASSQLKNGNKSFQWMSSPTLDNFSHICHHNKDVCIATQTHSTILLRHFHCPKLDYVWLNHEALSPNVYIDVVPANQVQTSKSDFSKWH